MALAEVNGSLGTGWVVIIVLVSLFCLLAVIAVAIAIFYFNKKRSRRETIEENINKSIPTSPFNTRISVASEPEESIIE